MRRWRRDEGTEVLERFCELWEVARFEVAGTDGLEEGVEEFAGCGVAQVLEFRVGLFGCGASSCGHCGFPLHGIDTERYGGGVFLARVNQYTNRLEVLWWKKRSGGGIVAALWCREAVVLSATGVVDPKKSGGTIDGSGQEWAQFVLHVFDKGIETGSLRTLASARLKLRCDVRKDGRRMLVGSRRFTAEAF